MQRKHLIFLIFFVCYGFLIAPTVYSQTYELFSPNNKIKLIVTVGSNVTYSVDFDGQSIINPSPVSLTMNGDELGRDSRVTNINQRSENRVVTPVIKQKRAQIVDEYNELEILFRKKFSLIFRAYDGGVAYCFNTRIDQPVFINSELATFHFSGDYFFYFPEEESIYTHFERNYQYLKLSEVSPDQFCSTPILVEIPNGPWVAITESGLENYPGLFLQGTGKPGLVSKFASVVLEVGEPARNYDRNEVIKKRADYLAKTPGNRHFPWRVIMIAERDGNLIENEMVYQLAKDCEINDPSWIKPGKVAWDWWNANNIYGVEFPAGINTNTYKYYIDFAAKYGLDYVILDEGWSKTTDVLQVVPEIDMEILSQYAQKKQVGLILWVLWKPLLKQLDAALDRYQKWDIKGIKVDFMQRDDQEMVNNYWKIAKAAAEHHLLVDFHGAYKPAGLRRTYPNVITREGVKGLEWSKWSEDITPEHTLTIPFIRMLAGPMDFTPGAMNNAQKINFKAIFNQPMSMGTRCHQLAMYIIYESPLQMLSDNPSNYYKEPETMEFLSTVPVVWDDTKVLDARVADFVVIARRNGKDWYIGAMTDGEARELSVDFSFLEETMYRATIYQDGINAHRYGSDYKKLSFIVSKSDVFKIKLAPGGGWVARLTPVR
jgi:alpha-glucosidase